MVVSPSTWGAHFLLCYVTAAVFCAKSAAAAPLGWVQWAVAGYTALALAVIGISGWSAWKRHRFGESSSPHADDTPEDRHRFLGYATFLLSVLSGVGVVFTSLAAVFIGSCR
ncbi:MAG: hypothetical protein AB7T31_12240 [Gemmatimonadales bacterium]